MTTRKLQYKAVNDIASSHVGQPGDIFYDPAVAELRMYDGTPGGMTVGSDLTTVTSHILPAADLTYDLGSTSSQWRSLYVGTSTIYIGGTPVSVSGGSLTVGGITISSNSTATIAIQGDNINLEFTEPGQIITVAQHSTGSYHIPASNTCTITASIIGHPEVTTILVSGYYLGTDGTVVHNVSDNFPLSFSSNDLATFQFIYTGLYDAGGYGMWARVLFTGMGPATI